MAHTPDDIDAIIETLNAIKLAQRKPGHDRLVTMALRALKEHGPLCKEVARILTRELSASKESAPEEASAQA